MSDNTPAPLDNVMITNRSDAPEDGTVIITPRGVPNVVILLMSPLAQVAVRGLRTYAQSTLGFLILGVAARPVAESLGVVIPPGDFLMALKVAAGLALAPTVVSLLQNSAELLAQVDSMFPRSRA